MYGDSEQKVQELLFEPLSKREIEILNLIADNLSKREIAEELSLAYSTVKWYTQQTYQKLSVHNRRQAVLRARELGLLEFLANSESSYLGEPNCWVANPYKGLLAFEEADAPNFFGREALTGRLVARLGEGGEARRFLALVGSSGSGKSSLVKAGLIPALRRGALPGSEEWSIAGMTPGIHPFEEFEASLLGLSGKASLNLMELLGQDEDGILKAARLALPNHQSELLLVIDQFEEIFTLAEDKDEARCFMENLRVAVTDQGSSLRVVITLRADFFDRLLLAPGLSQLVQDHTEVVIPLVVDELERAIRMPAQRAGVGVQSGLVAAVVADMVEQPGALPLLQYALTEIFEQRTGSLLTLDGYQAIGGLRGVLERRAEDTYAGLSQPGKTAARQAFLRLVALGEGVSTGGLPAPDARRRVLRSELEAMVLKALPVSSKSDSLKGENAAPIAEVLKAFGKARLFYFDHDVQARRPTVEITHEALLSDWGRLQGWLEEGREDVRIQRTLERAAADWVAAGQDASFLLRGTRLGFFEQWFRRVDVALTSEEQAFLEASMIQAGQAKSKQLAMLAINNLEADPELSILLSLQALRTANTSEAVNALHRSVQSSRVRATLTDFAGVTGGVNSVDFSPDGEAIAAASDAGEVVVWQTGSWRKLFSLPGEVARFSPDGRRLATGRQDGTITMWDLSSRQRLWAMKGHNKFIDNLSFSLDGRMMVSISEDHIFVVWDVETGKKLFSSSAAYFASFSLDGRLLATSDPTGSEPVLNLWGMDHNWALLSRLSGYGLPTFSPDGRWLVAVAGSHHNGIALWDLSRVDLESPDLSTVEPKDVFEANNVIIDEFTFSPDGSLLASANRDGTVKVWHLSDQGLEPLMTLSGHTGGIYDTAFSPDGTRLATTGQDGTMRIWDVTPAGASEWFAFAGHTNRIYKLALTQDGRYLATASMDRSAKVWDLQAGEQLLAITNHGGSLFGVGLSPDGSWLATAASDNISRIWQLDLAAGKATPVPLLSLSGHATGPPIGSYPGLTNAIFSPDGAKLATGGVDGKARIWDLKIGRQLLSVQVHPNHNGVTRLAFSPDGRRLATASDGPAPLAKVWDVTNGTEISTFSGHRQTLQIWGLAFSPDGERVATGDREGGLKIWDAQTGRELLNLAGHTAVVYGVAFSPDGRFLASASLDGTARVWDASSGEAFLEYTSPSGPLFGIVFTPDGKHLIASGMGTIYGYIFDQDELVRLAESRLTRGFTQEECRQFLHQEECPPQ